MIESPPMLAGTPAQQLTQMRTYLYQLAERLNVALVEIDKKADAATVNTQSAIQSGEQERSNGYAALRDLIIKTADTVIITRDEINQTLQSEYVAKSNYGTYYEQIEANVKQTAENVLTQYNFDAKIEDVSSEIEGLNNWTAHVEGYIRQGIIGEDEFGLPVIGIAIGQNLRSLGRQTVNGVEYDVLDDTQSCAFYTSTGISFRLGGKEVAYLTNEKELVTDLVVGSTLTVGNWLTTTDNGLAVKWIGG